MHTLKDNKRFLLGVYPAPEPSTIIWENLKYGTVSEDSICIWLKPRVAIDIDLMAIIGILMAMPI